MSLDEQDLKSGVKFIVGTWQVDYIVNTWSRDLAHLPAAEFKTKDGKDLSQLSYEFLEDHTVKLKNPGLGVEETGTWKQVSSDKFEYTFDKLFDGIDPAAVKELNVLQKDMEGGLVFSFTVFVVRFKKTAEGHITKEPDIGDLVPTAEEAAKKDIVGRWKVWKTMAMVDGDMDMYTRAEAEADLKKREANPPKDDDEADDLRRDRSRFEMMFGFVIEFTENHKVLTLSPLPSDVPKEEIDKAVASGEVTLRDGMLLEDPDGNDWKYVKGDYWYDSQEEAEVCGEPISPWKKITPDADGHIDFKMFLLERA